ncbi:MAG: peptidase U62 [Bryobacterales bacterium]|nr:peptidase U62 [Bryobacterales bacterium]
MASTSRAIRATCLFWLLAVTPGAVGDADPLPAILAAELERNFSVLKERADPPPYFLSYALTDQRTASVQGTLGAILGANQRHSRFLDVSVRVGSPELDNYHRVRGEFPSFTGGSMVPVEDVSLALRRRLWIETDRTWRRAADRLIKIKTNTQVKVAEEDDSHDFSEEKPAAALRQEPPLAFDQSAWEGRVRKLSVAFRKYPAALTSQVSVFVLAETKYLVSTEGSRIRHGRGFARIIVSAVGRAEDGMDLSTSESFEAVDAAGLPDDAAILAAIDRVGRDLTGLIQAPVVEPYVGPAILSGRAAGVLFHEIFGHRIEGHRQKDESEGQTFTRSVGSEVLPTFLSVVFDPTRRKEGTTDLNGWYDFDDEGVAARPVTAVEDGVLREFLMSRSPIRGFPQSNGHGRRQVGREVVARQSNLLVRSSRSVPEARLREMLIEEVKRQGKPFGFYFDQVTGGFTTTGRGGLQAFKVLPVVVYRVYPDGRPDELVRGVDIVGTPLASFAKIAATGDRTEVFNGYCGAESGSVPVSAVAPALLVTEIEIEKRQKSEQRPPLLPPPSVGDGA